MGLAHVAAVFTRALATQTAQVGDSSSGLNTAACVSGIVEAMLPVKCHGWNCSHGPLFGFTSWFASTPTNQRCDLRFSNRWSLRQVIPLFLDKIVFPTKSREWYNVASDNVGVCRAPKSPKCQKCCTFFNAAHLLPKDLRFDHAVRQTCFMPRVPSMRGYRGRMHPPPDLKRCWNDTWFDWKASPKCFGTAHYSLKMLKFNLCQQLIKNVSSFH